MTRPGLSGVWKNVMVMYKNMVGLSNVTGNMVLTGHSMASLYKRFETPGMGGIINKNTFQYG